MRLCVLLGLVAALTGCAGKMDQPPETTNGADSYVSPWTDTSNPPPQADSSMWPTPDSYVPAPFGCREDNDCFGLRCCQTPWGVRLCAATCPES